MCSVDSRDSVTLVDGGLGSCPRGRRSPPFRPGTSLLGQRLRRNSIRARALGPRPPGSRRRPGHGGSGQLARAARQESPEGAAPTQDRSGSPHVPRVRQTLHRG